MMYLEQCDVVPWFVTQTDWISQKQERKTFSVCYFTPKNFYPSIHIEIDWRGTTGSTHIHAVLVMLFYNCIQDINVYWTSWLLLPVENEGGSYFFKFQYTESKSVIYMCSTKRTETHHWLPNNKLCFVIFHISITIFTQLCVFLQITTINSTISTSTQLSNSITFQWSHGWQLDKSKLVCLEIKTKHGPVSDNNLLGILGVTKQV